MKPITTALALFFLLRSVALAQSVIDPSLTVQPLVSGLNSPTGMVFIGPDDILVLQKNDGRVRRVVSGVLQAGEVLDVAVDGASERGLLGIALHPQFPVTPSVYLYFTESSTGTDTSGLPTEPTPFGNRVYRYTWSGSKLTSPRPILALPVTPGPNHDGGKIAFGPDDKLYVVIGDLNRNGQLQNFSSGPPPDDTGVIFRLNDDGSTPTDNPFRGVKEDRYYAYGIRNSFGMTFDPVTGKLWITENGPNLYDEINLVEAGFNSGWEQLMGPDVRDPQGIGNLFVIPGAHYRDPSFSWLDTVGPTGLVFLNSTALGSQYLNNLFVGDINGGVLYRFRPTASRDGFVFQNSALFDRVADNSSELNELVFGTGFGGITDIKVGPDGFLYVVSFSGQIFVVSPARPVDTTPPNTSVTGGPTGTITVNSATFTWSGTDNVTSTPNLVYAYRLAPLEPNFSAFGSATTKSYTNLPSGNYTFFVKAKDQAGNADPTPASRAFTVSPSGSCPTEIIRDNLGVGQSDTFRSFTGTWAVSGATGQFGTNSLFSNGGGSDTYSWKSGVFSASQGCTYRVDVWWTQHANRSTTVPITVSGHSGGATTLNFNEQINGGKWNTHGTYTFAAGAQATVQVSDQNGQAAADAARFVLMP
jgi:aldose sugar dehydrogenase